MDNKRRNKMNNTWREWCIKKSLRGCLRALAKLQQAFFVNYLRKDYIKHQLQYQKALNKKVGAFFYARAKACRMIKHHPVYLDIFYRINHLSEIVFSLNQLRFRVTDYTTFKICAQELQQIEQCSVLLFHQLAQALTGGAAFDLPLLEEKIHLFEGIYNRTLQIVSVDPLVFMFFIQDLYALYDEIQSVHHAITHPQTPEEIKQC